MIILILSIYLSFVNIVFTTVKNKIDSKLKQHTQTYLYTNENITRKDNSNDRAYICLIRKIKKIILNYFMSVRIKRIKLI